MYNIRPKYTCGSGNGLKACKILYFLDFLGEEGLVYTGFHSTNLHAQADGLYRLAVDD